MDSMDAIHVHDMYASEYDRLSLNYGYVLPDALFGLCFEFLHHGQPKVLDIGIGTGLSSVPFASAGLAVYGLDGSVEMLKVCEKKKLAVELKPWDILTAPWPYADKFFDLAIGCGLIHFLPELEVIFSEVARLVRAPGIFAFTFKTSPPESQTGENPGRRYSTETIGGVPIYAHSPIYIAALLADYGFEPRKRLKVLLSRGPGLQEDVYTVIVSTKLDAKTGPVA